MDKISPSKILFVITKSNWGGAQVYVYTLAKRMQDAGMEVAVALGGTGLPGAEKGLLANRLESEGIRVIHLPSFARDISFLRELRAFRELLKTLREERPDVLHLNSSKAGGLGSLAGRFVGVRRIIFTAHGWAFRESESRSFFACVIIWLLSFATGVLAHQLIVVSTKDYDDAPVFFGKEKKVHVVKNGIRAFPLLPQNEARTALVAYNHGLAPLTHRLWLLITAELHPNKGIAVALRAFHHIANLYPDAIIVSIGTGEEREALEKLSASLSLTDRIFFLGFVPEARTYLNAADIFMLPSYKEGLPFVLLEAGMASLPVIASRTGGIPDVIRNGVTGALTEPGNPGDIAHALSALLKDKVLRSELGAHLHEKILDKFSEDKMVTQTLALYNKE